MSITFTGNNLNIVIMADQSFNHGWMTFSCWYSIHYYLPEAKVYFKIEKKEGASSAFAWTSRCPIKRIYHTNDHLVVPCHFMAVNEYTPNLFSKCIDEKDSTFADYSVCGAFSLENCTNIPFWDAEKFMTKKIPIKGKRVLDLWVKMREVFLVLQDDLTEQEQVWHLGLLQWRLSRILSQAGTKMILGG
jgi:hypothetical protein